MASANAAVGVTLAASECSGFDGASLGCGASWFAVACVGVVVGVAAPLLTSWVFAPPPPPPAPAPLLPLPVVVVGCGCAVMLLSTPLAFELLAVAELEGEGEGEGDNWGNPSPAPAPPELGGGFLFL
jgi:hypothetical protein